MGMIRTVSQLTNAFFSNLNAEGCAAPAHLLQGIPVHGLYSLGGIAHGNDPVRHIREVQVEPLPLKPPLLFAHHLLDGIAGHRGGGKN